MTAPTPTTTRGRGRPRKQPENPDCEVATRGYAKCLMRKMIDEDNYQYYYNESGHWQGVPSFGSAIIFMFAWAIAMDMKTEPIAAWVIGGACILCIIMAFEAHCMPIIYAEEQEHRVFEKYEPPCEPKRGCEEQE